MEPKAIKAMKSARPDKIKDERGFSLVELMIAATLVSVIALLATITYLNSANAADTTINISKAATEARTAMYSITKDLREVNGIIEASDDEVKFYSNVDQDDDFEEVHYYIVENSGFYSLYRDYEGISRIMSTRIISDQIFEYYTAYGEDSLATPVDSSELGNIKSIGIKLLIDRETTVENSRTMNLETSITLRNNT